MLRPDPLPFPPLHPALARALADKKYLEPTDVQRAVLEAQVGERDLLISAQTGSGKTVAIGLAMVSTLLGDAERFGAAGAPLALMIAPTRELAMQVKAELDWLYAHTGVRTASCVGGMDIKREVTALKHGAHIVVGTPGRLRDHLERGRLVLSGLRAAVLDEADEMLNLGFREDLEFILQAMPTEKRTMLLSATIPRDIAALAKRYQRDALRIDTVDHSTPHSDIEYRAIRCAAHDVEGAVVNLLRYFESPNTLVFAATREGVKRLTGRLLDRGFSVVSLSGEMKQSDRTQALKALRDGRARVCVATDVAARGLDLPLLDLVVHADLPNDRDTLLHRSGRTGRAGRKGISAIIVPGHRRRKAEELLHNSRLTITNGTPPTAAEIRTKDRERFLADPLFAAAPEGDELEAARALIAERGADVVAAALLRMHQARLPTPAEFTAVAPESARDRKPAHRDDRKPAHRDDRKPAHRDDRGGDAPAPRTDSRRPEGPMAWFSMSVGRLQNADPRWLLPIICRLGNVTKAEIGAIRIFEGDTRFQVVETAAAQFLDAASKPNDENIQIGRSDSPPDPGKASFNKPRGFVRSQGDKPAFAARPPFKSAPFKERPVKSAPFTERPAKAAPFKERPVRSAPFKEAPAEPARFKEGGNQPFRPSAPFVGGPPAFASGKPPFRPAAAIEGVPRPYKPRPPAKQKP